MYDFSNKTCLIAGNLGKLKKNGKFTMGLGATIAKDLLSAGATVIVTSIDQEEAKACAEALEGNIHYKTCDFLEKREATIEHYESDRGPKTRVNWVQNDILKIAAGNRDQLEPFHC